MLPRLSVITAVGVIVTCAPFASFRSLSHVAVTPSSWYSDRCCSSAPLAIVVSSYASVQATPLSAYALQIREISGAYAFEIGQSEAIKNVTTGRSCARATAPAATMAAAVRINDRNASFASLRLGVRFLGGMLRLDRLDGEVLNRLWHLFEPMRHAGGDRDRVALLQVERLAAVDRRADLLVRPRLLCPQHR